MKKLYYVLFWLIASAFVPNKSQGNAMGAIPNPYITTSELDFSKKATDLFDLNLASIQTEDDVYCIPEYIYGGCDGGDRISKVVLAGESLELDNESGCSEDGYGDYTDLTPPDLIPGATYSLFVATDYVIPGTQEVKAWIDYNDNGVLEQQEVIAYTGLMGLEENGSYFDFTVPQDIVAGEYRMRIRLVYFGLEFNSCSIEERGETEDYTISIIEPEDCSGLHDAGVAQNSFSTCEGESFTLSVTDASLPAIGLERIWQSSPSGQDNWTDIENANLNTTTIEQGIEEPTDFRFRVTCTIDGNFTEVSNVVQVSLKPANQCYCVPVFSGDCQTYKITNIKLSGESKVLTNSTGCSGAGYGDYTFLEPADLTLGNTYTLSISTDAVSTSVKHVRAWIDYNQDGEFEDSEEIANTLGNGFNSDGTNDFNFIVPNGIDLGNYRMRVRLVFGGGSNIPPCASQNYGETEDYTVEIIDIVECSGTPNAGTGIFDEMSVCAGEPFLISTYGASSPAENLQKLWQFSLVGENTWEDIPGATADSYTVDAGVYESTEFRFKIQCGNDEPEYSDVLLVNLNPAIDCFCIPTYNNVCSQSNQFISNVSLTGETLTLDNTSECSDDNYGDYTDLPATDLIPGGNYTLSVSTAYSMASWMQIRAWIDYNNNGNFESLEEIANTQGAGLPGGSKDFNFIVPEGVQSGLYRLRVRTVQHINSMGIFDACSHENAGETEDYTIHIISLDGCDDIPDAGQPNDDFAVCADDAFTISAEAASEPAVGLERIWQSSPAGTTNWSDINGASTSNYLIEDGINEPMDFRYKVTCTTNGETDISDVVQVTLKTVVECYCIPNNNTYDHNYISNVSTSGALQNINRSSGFTEGGYSDYTETDIIVVQPGQQFSISISGSTSSMTYKVWMDLDQNGIFDEFLEQISSSSGNEGSPYESLINISANLEEGFYRIRIRVSAIPNSVGPCNDYAFGETEDYLIEITNPTCLPPTDISFNNVTPNSATVLWEAQPNHTSWIVIYGETNFNPENEGTSITVYDDPELYLGELDEGTTYDVYFQSICGDEDESFSVGPNSFTTATIPENNHLCDALELGINEPCTETYSNAYASIEDGESPGSCLDPLLHGTNSVWFSFIAEQSQVVVSTDFTQTDFITEIVAYEAPANCEDLFSLGDEIGCSADGSNVSLSDLIEGSTYYIKVTGSENTEGDFCIEVQSPPLPDSVIDHEFEDFMFYPNPARHEVNLIAENPIEEVTIHNSIGQMIMILQPNKTNIDLNIHYLDAGVYFMTVKLNGNEKTFKLVKE